MQKNEIRVHRNSTDMTKIDSSNLNEKVKLLLFYQSRMNTKEQEIYEDICKKINDSNRADILFSNLKKAISDKLNFDSYLNDKSIDKSLKSKIHSYKLNTEIFNRSYNNYETLFLKNKQNSIIEFSINDNLNFLKNDLPRISHNPLNKLITKKIRSITKRYYNPSKGNKQWEIKKNALKEILISDKKNSAFIYFKLTEWRIKNSIPAQIFVEDVNKDNDPPFYQYINLEIPIFIFLFKDIIKNANEIITFKESLN